MLIKLQDIKEIVLNNKTFKISFFVGGDLKWLSEIYGINKANSHYPCPWCTWKVKNEMIAEDITELFSIHGRSHDDAQICLQSSHVDEKKGYVRTSLFPFIGFNKMVVDILHMTLRITDKLLDMLFVHLEELDKKISSEKLMSIFKKFLEIQCNITSPFIKLDSEKKAKLRMINSNERLKIMEKLFESQNTLASIFPKNFRKDVKILRLNILFNKFKEILDIIKLESRHNFDSNAFKKLLQEWLKKFIEVEPRITPYIHIFCFHMPEFIEVHGNLNLFSMQGLEKLNSFSKTNYFRATNHHKNTFTSTLLNKMNRIDFIHLNGELNNDVDLNGINKDAYKDSYSDMFDFLNEDEEEDEE